MPKKLFAIHSFRWYSVDVAYDIDKGTYDLKITEENHYTPLINLESQKNSSNNPNSIVNIFSFVTDPFTDKSNLTYYVDDVIIGLDQEILKTKFVAPGRKKYFVDMWDEYQYKLRQKPGCLPAVHPYDFGISDDDIILLESEGMLDYIEMVANGKSYSTETLAQLPTHRLQLFEGL
ncbi:MAG: hypothetical protein GTN99_04880, partial [Candidatus Dadabacteria bacterium]|nr:hypothetical protein [Candidatus Dadabacteria bacterium]